MLRRLPILIASFLVIAMSIAAQGPATIVFIVKQAYATPSQPVERVAVVVKAGVLSGTIPLAGAKSWRDAVPGLPSDVEVVELPDGVILPGLILAHSRTLAQVTDPEESLTPGTVAADAFDPFDSFKGVTRGGVTAAYISPGFARIVAGQGSAVRLAGADLGGEVLVRSVSLRVSLSENIRSAPNVFNPPLIPDLGEPLPAAEMQPGKTRAGALDALRSLFRRAGSEARDPKWTPSMDDVDLRPFARALSGEISVRVACDREADVAGAIELAREFKLRLIIEGGNEAWMHAAALASINASVVLRAVATPPIGNSAIAPLFHESGEGRRTAAALLIKAGVPVAVVPPFVGEEGEVLFHATRLMGDGFGPSDVLTSVTTAPAKMLGLPDGTGTLVNGRLADLAVYSRSPFAYHERPMMVVSNGRVVHRAARKSEVVAVTVGRIHTCDGDPIDNGTIVIEDGKIRAVGRNVVIPAGARRIVRPDAVVVPGFVDAGTQVGLRSYVGLGDGAMTLGPKFGATGTEQWLVDSFDPTMPDLNAAARAGVTSAGLTPGMGKLVAGPLSVVKTGGANNSILARQAGVMIDLTANPGGAALSKQLDGFVESAKKYHESWTQHDAALAEWKRGGKSSLKAPESRSLGAITAPKSKDPVSGTWTGELRLGRSPRPLPLTITLALEGTKVTGELTMSMGNRRGGGQPPKPMPFEGTFEGGKLKVSATQGETTITVEATVGRDLMEGTVKLGPLGEAEFSASRSGSTEAGASSTSSAETKPASAASAGPAEDGRPKAPAKTDSGEAWRPVIAGKAAIFVYVTGEAQVDSVLEVLRAKHELKVVVIGIGAFKQALNRYRDAGVAFCSGGEMLQEDGVSMSPADLAFRSKLPVLFRSGTGDTRELYGMAEMAVREGVDPEDALRMITRQPARFLGVLERVGSLERGKDADVVLLSGEPFAPGTHVIMTIIDGKLVEEGGAR